LARSRGSSGKPRSTAGRRLKAARARGAASPRRARALETALRESEARHRALAEGSIQGICIHRDFTILFANPALATMFGFESADELIGLDLRSAFPLAARIRLEGYRAARLHGMAAPLRYECPATRNDHARIWVEILASVVSWAGGPAVLETVLDITGRRRAEGLAAGEVRVLEMIGSRVPLPEILQELTRMIEAHADETLASILLLDENHVPLRHGAAPSLPESYVDLALAHGLPACWSTPILSADGRVLGTFALYYREPREPGPGEQRLIEIATRLARIAIEHARGEQALRASEEGYRLLFERNLAGVFRVDSSGRVLECNPALAQILGYSAPEAVLAINARDLYVDPASRDQLLARLHPDDTVTNHEVQWRRADGTAVWVLLNVRQIRQGALTWREGIAIDVTDRKRAEEVARETAALRTVAHLANAAAHEINNPLTTVVGRLDMLAQRLPEGSRERELVAKARAGSNRIHEIVSRMHHITRIEYLAIADQDLSPILDIRRSSEA